MSARTSAAGIIAALRVKWENVCNVEAGRQRNDQPGWWERTAATPANVVECEGVAHLKATLKATEEADKLLVLDFYRPNCSACRALHPKLEQLAAEYSDHMVLVKVDTRLDEAVYAMSQRMGVEKVPYFQVGERVCTASHGDEEREVESDGRHPSSAPTPPYQPTSAAAKSPSEL